MKKTFKKISILLISAVLAVFCLFAPERRKTFNIIWDVQAESLGDEFSQTEKNAIGALLTVMLANGIRFVGGVADQGKALADAVGQWASDTANNITLGAIGAGVAVYNGALKIAGPINNAIVDFMEWFRADKDLTLGQTQDFTYDILNNNYLVYSGGDFPIELNDHTYYYWEFNNTGIRIVHLTSSDDSSLTSMVWFISKENFKYRYSRTLPINSTWSSAANYVTNNETYYYYYLRDNIIPNNIPSIINRDWYYVDNAIKYTYGDLSGGIDDLSLEGQTYDLKDGYTINDDQAILYDVNTLATYAGLLDQALTDINQLEGLLAQALSVANTNTGTQALPWQLVNSETDSSVIADDSATVNTGEISQYKVTGLHQVFPFSLPFDIYYLVKMLEATPEPLKFTLPFYITGIIDEEYTFDFTDWEPLAKVIRISTLISFMIFLIIKTRDMIRS